ncbi:Nif3-like dinuclear metal center hexameric protein [uncultured Ferrimonas sp.]|uniref:Nif3-like dinuclear metal center hexameric protein n=1 Tax=uncultured Ferrimonas sp. TaxID=432640 RepID=UPI002621A36F|nr:Nif3-like dinuclear metal center hexameric protein [uncultured Ferrimonas sp.]
MQRQELLSYLDGLLKPWQLKDYAPNGLQVEGRDEIHTIVTAVTADQRVLDKAVELGADCVLVHHGYFWKSEPAVITGMKQRRLKALLCNDINLIGYHLPLDVHPELGNNAQLARLLRISNVRPLHEGNDTDLVLRGEFETAMSGAELAEYLGHKLGRQPLHIAGHNRPIKTLAWCSGGAQDYLDEVASFGLDAFISGEVSERTYHSAVEQGIDYFAAGHHATERGGIQALGDHLASKFFLDVHFVDTPNPV